MVASSTLEPLMVISLGKPKEKVVLTEMEGNNYNYYRDEKKIHYVPKRSLEEVIIEKK